MKDVILLLAAAVVVAIVSWAFWHYAGDQAGSVLSSVALIALIVDNIRLRRLLKKTRT